jgi:hypothetical protein
MKSVSLQTPEAILTCTGMLLETLIVAAYLFIIFWQRAEAIAVFDKFELQMKASFRAYEWRKGC